MNKLELAIAFSGKFASGKTTQALFTRELLRDNHNHPEQINIHRFALPLKVASAHALGIDLAELDDPAIKAKARTVLQAVGQAGREIHGPDYWVKQAVAEALSAGTRTAIIDDMRISDEIENLSNMAEKVVTIRINVSLPVLIARYKAKYGVEPTGEQMMHLSEIGLDQYDKWDLVLNGDLPLAGVQASLIVGLTRLGVYQVQRNVVLGPKPLMPGTIVGKKL